MPLLAPGNIYNDTRLIQWASIYRVIIDGSVISDREIAHGRFGAIPLVALGDKKQFRSLQGF